MSRRNSGVFYYSDVAEPADVETKDQKFNTITAAKSPKLKSSGSSKDITFTVINNAIAGETQQVWYTVFSFLFYLSLYLVSKPKDKYLKERYGLTSRYAILYSPSTCFYLPLASPS
jgi:hypothetical protein